MRLFILFFSGILLFSCQKTEKAPALPAENVTLSMDSTQLSPGDPAIIKLNKKSIQNEVSININSTIVKGYASGDSAYVFFVPVLATGTANLSIPALKNSNILSITVKNYAVISDPQVVINEFVSKRNSSIDSITKVISGSNYQPSAQTLQIINQVKEEWEYQIARLPAADKELTAYILRKMMPDLSTFSFGTRKAGFAAKDNGLMTDAGDRLVALAKVYVTTKIICLSTIPVIVASLYTLIVAPNPISALILAGAISVFIITREATIRKAKEIGDLPEVAEAITESTAQRIMANEFFNNTEKVLNMKVLFRNLNMTDAGIQPNITNAFNGESDLLTRDKEVETMYNKSLQYTSKLKASYDPYVAFIGKRALVNNTLSIEGDKIIIKSISDNRINYTTSLTGTDRKIKITSTSTTEINFDLIVAYRRILDGKEFTKTINCLYKPEFDSTAFYQVAVLGKWDLKNIEYPNDPPSNLELYAGGTGKYTGSGGQPFPNGGYNITWWITRNNGKYYFYENGFVHPAYNQYRVIGNNLPMENLTYPLSFFKTYINLGSGPVEALTYTKK